MSRWLIKWYPIEPAQHLTVINLDVLDDKDYCSKNYQQDVKYELEELLSARVKTRSYYACNNKWMRIIEVDSMKEAIDIFFNEFDRR